MPAMTGVYRFGSSIAGLGDINGDGIPDLASGAPWTDIGGYVDTGVIYVLFLSTSGSVTSYTILSNSGGGLEAAGLTSFAHLSFGMASADLDGDGRNELIAPSAKYTTTDVGKVLILNLTTSGTVNWFSAISQGEGGFTGDLHP